MPKKKIAIIGAGLAGLNCARLLEKDFDVSLFDKEPQVGGRILSSHEDGYILDHGFQVLLPNYPEAKKAFNYKELQLMNFTPGALIRVGSFFYKFSDPLRQPQDIMATMLTPIGNLKDKLLILKLKIAAKSPSEKLKKISTSEYLKDFGFSEDMINGFFNPFFSGVFLERELKTSAYFFLTLFSLFSSAKAAVPKNGMMELPLNLLRQLKTTNIFLSSKITNLTSYSLRVNGTEQIFDSIVCAYDNKSSHFNTLTTDYFTTDQAIALKPTLYLNANKKGSINHIAPMSLANPEYSPKGKYLWSVNLLTPHEKTSVIDVQKELSEWFLGASFTHLKRFTIEKALPNSPQFGGGDILSNGIYHCGDQMQDPSINGALKSGRLVAELIISKSSYKNN
jgi:hypothetical protein